MRTPSQTQKAVEADLKHLSTALDRAKANTLRSDDKARRVVQLLSELVTIYTQEKIEFIAGKFSSSSNGKKKVA